VVALDDQDFARLEAQREMRTLRSILGSRPTSSVGGGSRGTIATAEVCSPTRFEDESPIASRLVSTSEFFLASPSCRARDDTVQGIPFGRFGPKLMGRLAETAPLKENDGQ
jgi:hypothetical protein